MKRLTTLALMVLLAAGNLFAKTHKEDYPVSCATLWPAVKDTLRNSGKYGIIGIDSNELTASFNIGGSWTGKRINSVVLNSKGDAACEMQVQTAFSGLANNDYGDFKKRVEESLAKLKSSAPAAAAPTAAPAAAAPTAAPAPEKQEAKPDAKPETKSDAKPNA